MARKIQDTTQKGPPLKRHEALIPFSKEHHFILLLSWKIRTGRKKNVSKNRIARYVNHFFNTQLLPHFIKEETLLFPQLDKDHEVRLEVEAHHERLRELFNDLYTHAEDSWEILDSIEEELEAHIRYEERIFYPTLQRELTEEALTVIAQSTVAEENEIKDEWDDPFWA